MAKNPLKVNSFPSADTDNWDDPCQVEIADSDTEKRLAIKESAATEAVIAAMRDKVDKRNKGIAVLIDESKGQSALRLAEALSMLDNAIVSDDVIRRVEDSIKTAKDFSDYVAAREKLHNIMMKQSTTTADRQSAGQGIKDMKVAVNFGDGKQVLIIGGESNGQ